MNLLKILFSSFSLIYALKLNPTIKKTAKYSAQAYNKEFNKLNSKLITKFDDNIGICAYEDKKDLILTIRGTCNFEDWKVNLNCFLVLNKFYACVAVIFTSSCVLIDLYLLMFLVCFIQTKKHRS